MQLNTSLKDKRQVLSLRIPWIDIAKGYALLLVILGHILPSTNDVTEWLYSFHMPLFFFLSGYVFSNKRNFKTFVSRKLYSNMIPYFFFGFIAVMYDTLYKCYTTEFTLKKFIDYFDNYFNRIILQKGYTPLWYLICLFILNLFFYVLTKKISKCYLQVIIILSIHIVGALYSKYINIKLFWRLDTLFFTSLFFYCGYLFKLHYKDIKEKINVYMSVFIFIILGLINLQLCYLNLQKSGTHLDIFCSSYAFLPYTLLAAFLGLTCVIIFSHWFNIRPIRYLGENSLVYFALHKLFIPFLNKITNIITEYFNISNSYSVIIVSTALKMIFILTACTIIHIIISNSRYDFLLGKQTIKKDKNIINHKISKQTT